MQWIADFLRNWGAVLVAFLGGGIITFLGLLINARGLLQNLERSRRELAVNLISSYAKEPSWSVYGAFTIVTKLSDDAV